MGQYLLNEKKKEMFSLGLKNEPYCGRLEQGEK